MNSAIVRSIRGEMRPLRIEEHCSTGDEDWAPSYGNGLVDNFLFLFWLAKKWLLCIPTAARRLGKGEGPRSSLFTAFAVAGTTTTFETLGHLHQARRAQLGSNSSWYTMDLTFHSHPALLGFGPIFIANVSNADPLVTIKEQSGEIIHFQ